MIGSYERSIKILVEDIKTLLPETADFDGTSGPNMAFKIAQAGPLDLLFWTC